MIDVRLDDWPTNRCRANVTARGCCAASTAGEAPGISREQIAESDHRLVRRGPDGGPACEMEPLGIRRVPLYNITNAQPLTGRRGCPKSKTMNETGEVFDPSRFSYEEEKYTRRVVRTYSPLVAAVCSKYAEDWDHRQDLCQETWTVVCAKANTYRPTATGSFRAWLYRVTTNVCISDLRFRIRAKEAMERYRVRECHKELWEDPRVEGEKTARETVSRAIWDSVATLPTRQHQAVTLTVLAEKSIQETAQIMGVVPATVRSHLRHAVQHLRKRAGPPSQTCGPRKRDGGDNGGAGMSEPA